MSEPIVDDVRRFLLAHCTGDLRFDEHLRTLKYVVAPEGRLAAPVMVAMLQSLDTVLFVPEFAEGAMEVQVTLEQFEENGPHGGVADRWRIYHGDPPDVRWAFLGVDDLRYEGRVIDGDEVPLENPLREIESSLCRLLNQRARDDLRALCLHFADAEVEDPVVVGVDPGGIMVRRSFDVIRVETDESLTADNAEQILTSMLGTAIGDGP
jgi:hypothetical protein